MFSSINHQDRAEETSGGRIIVPCAIVSAYALGLLVLSIVSFGDSVSGIVRDVPGRHVTGHVVGYAVFTILLCYALRSVGRRGAVVYTIQAFLLATLYGGILEFVQIPISVRHASWQDVCVNAAGALIGGGLWLGARWVLSPAARK